MSWETEEEYWKLHKEYSKKMRKLRNSALKFIKNPHNYFKEFEILLNEMLKDEIVTSEWVQEQKVRFYKEMNSPSEFKDWLGKKKDALLKKFKRK